MKLFELQPSTKTLLFQTALDWMRGPLVEEKVHHWSLTPEPRGLRGHLDAPYQDDPPPTDEDVRRLWEFEVAELFLAGPSGHYCELELSPHGLHLLLAFSGPRIQESQPPSEGLRELVVERSGDRWAARFLLPWAWVPSDFDRLNSFGLHGQGQQRCYLLAAPLPGDAPDFHQPQHFPRLPTGFGRP